MQARDPELLAQATPHWERTTPRRRRRRKMSTTSATQLPCCMHLKPSSWMLRQVCLRVQRRLRCLLACCGSISTGG
jgi:hypothetical protein